MELNIEVMDLISNYNNFSTCENEIITIGRDKKSDISLDNKYISDHHVSLYNSEGIFHVEDENSSNGTEIYLDSKWSVLGNSKTQVSLPLRLRLSETVVVTIRSNESQIISLSDIEHYSAIMVLDQCGSTNQAANNEKIAFHLKTRLLSIAKPIVYEESVEFFKNTGDGFMATFSTTEEAMKASKSILQTLDKRNNLSKNPPINIRIGLHRGPTYVIDPTTEDVHGMDINVTFRIEGLKKSSFRKFKPDIGENNRILCSDSFYNNYIENFPKKKSIFHDCGLAKLKGLKSKMKIFRVDWK